MTAPLFVLLTRADPLDDPREVWVNLGLVQSLIRLPADEDAVYDPEPARTRVWFGSSGPDLDDCDYEFVLETPGEILALAARMRERP